MGLISIILLIILVISAILLVLVVLVQDDQGEGIGGIFGGGSNTAFGSRSGNVLTRFTAVLATIFLVCCFGVAWINRTPAPGNVIGRARQQALGTTEQQSWWVQTTPVRSWRHDSFRSWRSDRPCRGFGPGSVGTAPAGAKAPPSGQGGQ